MDSPTNKQELYPSKRQPGEDEVGIIVLQVSLDLAPITVNGWDLTLSGSLLHSTDSSLAKCHLLVKIILDLSSFDRNLCYSNVSEFKISILLL